MPLKSVPCAAVALSLFAAPCAGAGAESNTSSGFPATITHEPVSDRARTGPMVMQAQSECEPEWVPTFGSSEVVHGVVHALAIFDDGSGGGPALHASGWFMNADGTGDSWIARWNGSSWSPLGSPLSSGIYGEVFALTVFDEGSGDGPTLYAGGNFTIIGDVAANRIAKWDGRSWSPLGAGMSSEVSALTVFDDGSGGGPALYAGGFFTTAGGTPANSIAKWDGSSWSPLGSGVNSAVHALTVFDEGSGDGPALYAGGNFTTAGGVAANHIARWDGQSWSTLGAGMNGTVTALTAFDDGSGGGPALCAGGWFWSTGDVTVNGIARWDGSSWSPLGSGLGTGAGSGVSALVIFDDGSGGGPALCAGGLFWSVGDLPISGIAKWDGSSWSPLGNWSSAGVGALTVFDDGSAGAPALYAGGTFTVSPAGDSFIAKWQGCPADEHLVADLNGDGIVDGADLGLLLGAWGSCAGCSADLNGDGLVDGADLGILLSAW